LSAPILDPVTLPTLETSRLTLRFFNMDDAADVQRLAGAREIADTTLSIPHPYEDGMAEQWIANHRAEYEEGTSVIFAVVLRDSLQLIGAIGLAIDRSAEKGDLGYWIGKSFWSQGFCTEAAGAVLDFGFATLGLNRISARHFARNPASGRVMEKIGMTREGTARQDKIKWGNYEDLVLYGILRNEWSAERAARPG
jgi:ribosomal-protein-alanine N-acetyltransferase